MKCLECNKEIELPIILIDNRETARFRFIQVPRTLRFCRIECMLMFIINEQMGNGLASGMGLCHPGESNRFWIKNLGKYGCLHHALTVTSGIVVCGKCGWRPGKE